LVIELDLAAVTKLYRGLTAASGPFAFLGELARLEGVVATSGAPPVHVRDAVDDLAGRARGEAAVGSRVTEDVLGLFRMARLPTCLKAASRRPIRQE
jgi:hypothetical protein